ncbi:MAG: hypothetical protein PHT40_00495 [Patescibacteria group bacterium]|nr:hypothetical protein [Patescibacteria group bacterium]
MKRGFVLGFTLFICFFLLADCAKRPEGPTIGHQLEEIGLMGEHQLMRTEHSKQIKGSLAGLFFLGVGGMGGSIESNDILAFYWEPKPGESIRSSLPYSKFRFIKDESKDIPTIEFVFDQYWLKKTGTYWSLGEEEILNPNLIINSRYLYLAKVKISAKTMEQEIYLPKAK